MRAAVATALVAACLALTGTESGAAEVVPTRVGVRATEFDLVLSRVRVPPGPTVIQLQNAGEDPHDLRVRREGGTRALGTGVVEPGEAEAIQVARLKRRATYRLWCSLPDHAEAGMEAAIRVRRRG